MKKVYNEFTKKKKISSTSNIETFIIVHQHNVISIFIENESMKNLSFKFYTKSLMSELDRT